MQQHLLESPTVEPISVSQAICHLREDEDDAQSDLIAGLIRSARDYVEAYTKQALVRQVWRATYGCFPIEIELPVSPVRKVTSIQYVDSAGTTQTLAASKYQVDLITSDRVRIRPVYGETWPSTQFSTFNAVTVNFVAGFAIPFTTVFGTDANALNATAQPLTDADVLQLWNTGGDLGAPLVPQVNYYVVNSATDEFELSLTSGGAPITLTADGDGLNFAGLIPAPIISAMLLIIGHLYENREQTIAVALNEIPMGVESLLMPYASVRF